MYTQGLSKGLVRNEIRLLQASDAVRIDDRDNDVSHYIIINNRLKIAVMLDSLKDKAADLLNNDTVKAGMDKAKEFINSEKGKEVIENAKDKVEDFVEEKTDGKGIFGFGKK